MSEKKSFDVREAAKIEKKKNNGEKKSFDVREAAEKRKQFDVREYAELERTIGFDTINDDLTSTNTTVNNIYKTWQDKDSLSSTKSSIENMYNRLNAYEEYRKKYGNDEYTDISDITSAYKSVLDDWDTISNLYGGYANAEEYNKAYEDYINSNKSPSDKTTPTDNLRNILDKEAMFEKAKNAPKRDATLKDLTINSVKQGWYNSDYGRESYKAMMGNDNNKEYYEEVLQGDDYAFETDNFFEDAVSGAANLVGQQARQYLNERSLALAATFAGIVGVAGQAGPQIALAEEVLTMPAAAVLGFQAGSVLSNFEIEAGHAYNELTENGIAPDTAMTIASCIGFGNAALEMVQLDDLVKSVKILGKSDAAKPILNKVLSFLAKRGLHVGFETGTEVAQEWVTLAGIDAARMIEGKEPIYNWGEVGDRLIDTGVSSALSFAALGGAGDAVKMGGSAIGKGVDVITGKGGKTVTTQKPIQNITQQPITEPDSLEKAAMDVVASRNNAETEKTAPTASGSNVGEQIPSRATTKPVGENKAVTIEEAQKVSGFGENGAKLFADTVNNSNDANLVDIKLDMNVAYMAGFSNETIDLDSDLKREAFIAGKKDRAMQDLAAKEKAKNATVYDGVFTENEYSKKLPSAIREMISTIAKDFGMSIEMVDKIVASVVNGKEYEANAQHYDGKMDISSAAELSKAIHSLVLHESGHRMEQFATDEWNVLANAIYARAERLGRRAELGASRGMVFDRMKSAHDNAGITKDTSGYFGEVVMRELETIFSSPEEFNAWRAELDGNAQVKTVWQKFMDYISQLINDVKRVIANSKLSKEARAQAKAELAELERIKALYAEAYKATRDAVAERAKEAQAKTNQNLEIKIKEDYNGNTSHSLKYEYTEKEYRDYGWARANDILNKGQNIDYRSKFADAVKGYAQFARSKTGEYIIPVSDILDKELEGIDNVLVFAKGTIKNPVITSVIKINADNETDLALIREYIYECERSGIQTEIEELFQRYNSTDREFKRQKSASSTTHSERYGNGRRSGAKNSATKEKSKVDYSLKDSEGASLTKEQAEYFKDSQVRDAEGNLAVMYQGATEDFTVFDRRKSSYANLYGRGFYFTNSKNHASQYGKTRAYYLNIKHPISTTETNITKAQLRKFLQAVKENEDYSFENYGYDATLDSVLNALYGKSDFLMLNDVSQTAIGDLVEAVELFNEVNGTDYDGIVLDTETVTFNSEQAKLTSNKKPTSNPDTRFSLKESVEETEDLIAVHNLSSEQLIDAIGRGQFIMPSVAVTNKGHFAFGDISAVFYKNTIDPNVNAENKLYGSDAWTPTQTRLKKNPKFDNDVVASTLKDLKKTIGGGYSQIFDISVVEFKKTITKADGSIYDAFSKNIAFQTAYAIENNLIPNVPKSNGKIDQVALKKQLNAKLDNDNEWRNYKKWLGKISDAVITSYDTASNEDVLNNMKAQPESAKTFRLGVNGELTVPAVEYKSIDDYKANKNRLSEDAEAKAKAVGKEFVDWAKSVNATLGDVVNAINSAFVDRYNVNNIVSKFADNGVTIASEEAKSLQALYKKAVELPTPYFEAKPRRAVGLDEIAVVVLPDNASKEVKSALDTHNIPYKEYGVHDNQSRIDAVNSVEGVSFSLKDSDYLEAVKSGDMETASKMVEEAAEKAFSNSKVRGNDGKLKIVYHGTVSDFTVFDRQFANIEGDMGKGYYFTSNEYDVDANYANEEGPDLKNKIARLAERLEWEDEYADLSYEEREEIARQRLITSEPNTISAYLNMENPVYISNDEEGTLLDFNEEYDEEYDEYGEPEGLFVDFVEALNKHAQDYAYSDVDFSFLYEHAYDGGMYASDVVQTIKHRIADELTDENGDLAINEVIRLAFEEIGFDGIIDTSVYYKFNNMSGMDSGTTHYIVFNSNQIKSADVATYDKEGNVIPISERFNKQNDDIRYSLKDMDEEYLELAKNPEQNEARLRQLVNEAAAKAGYTDDSSWKMQHSAPNSRDDVSLDKLKESGLVPDDFWQHPEWYTYSAEERESYYKVKKAIETQERRTAEGNPRDARMWVYRAVDKTKNKREDYFRNGDWVTPSYEYAVQEGKQNPDGYRIIKHSVSIKDLYWDGNSIAELGYDDGNNYAYADTLNNRKKLDLVTYTPSGQIIPLSKRFNRRDSDVNFSLKDTEAYSIEDIKAKYADKTDHLYIYEKKNAISIENMVVKKEYRNKGVGTSILNDIIDYADRVQKTITLTPTSEFGTKERLKKWYKANGFVENKGRKTDFTISDTMYRLPSGTSFSLKGTDDIDYKDRRELLDIIEHLKGEFELTKFAKADPKKLEKMTRDILKEYSSYANFDDTFKAIDELYTYMANGEDGHPPVWEDVYDRAYKIAKNIAESAIVVDDEMYRTYSGLRNYLRTTPMKFNAEHDSVPSGYENFNEFRKRNYGRLRFTKNGMGIDSVFQELSNLYPEFFNEEEISNTSDQLERIVQVLDDMQPTEINPFSDNEIEQVSMQLANDLASRFFDVPQAKPTFADKAERRVVEANIKGRKKVDAVRQQRDAKIKKLIESQRAKTKKLIEKLKASKADAVETEKAKRKDAISKMSESQKAKVLRARIIRHTGELSKKLVNPTDNQHIPQELQGAVATLLEHVNLESNYSYDVVSQSYKKNDEGLPAKRTKAFQELKKVYEKIASSVVVDPDLIVEGGLLSDVISLADKRIADMNSSELDTVWQTIRAIEASVSTANKVFSEGKFATILEFAEALREDNGNKADKKELRGVLGRGQKLTSLDMLTPETYFHYLGEAGDSIFRMMRDAQDKHISIMKEVQDFTHKELNGVNVNKLEKTLHTVTLGGQKVELTTAQLMELYALMKREQAVEHIFIGGILPDVIDTKGIFKKTKAEPIRNITQEEVGAALSKLTAEEKAIADKLQKFVSTVLSQYGNEASMKVYNYEKFLEENYWTIRTNKQEIASDVGKDTAVTSVANKGMAKGTVPHANTSVRIGSIFNTFASHSSDMATYAAWLGTTEDVNRIRNFVFWDNGARKGTVKGILDTVHGTQGSQYLEKLLTDISIGVKGTDTMNPLDKLTGAYKAASVGANIRVIIQQPTAILRALDMINPQYLTAGAIRPLKGWSKAKEHAPIAQWKDWGHFDINTGRQMKDVLFNNASLLEKTKQVGMWGASTADSLAWGQLWNAVEFETRAKHKDLEVGSEEYYETVSKRFTEIVDHTQVVDGILQRSGIMRSPDSLTKMATSFMGEPTKQYNMALAAAYDVKTKTGKAKIDAVGRLGRTATGLAVAGIVNACMQSIVDAMRDDDKEKDYWEKWLAAFLGSEDDAWFQKGGNLGDSFNPINFVPFAKDIASIFQGYDVKRMDMESISKLIKSAENMYKTATGTGKYTIAEASASLFADIARLFGVPVANVKRDIKSIVTTFANETDNYLMQYRIEKTMLNINYAGNNKNFMDILFNAYNNDREAYELIYKDLLKSGYEADKIQSGMETRMKKAEGVEKASDLSQRYMTPTDEKKYDSSLNKVKSSNAWKSANAEQRKNAEADLYNFLTSDSEAMEKTRAEATAFGVDETEYTLWQLAKEMSDANNNGSLNASEKAKAVDMLELGNSEIAYFYNTDVADEAYANGIDMTNYATFKGAIADLENSKVWKSYTDEQKKAAKIDIANRYSKTEKEYLFLIATEYSSYKKRSDYISYFGK